MSSKSIFSALSQFLLFCFISQFCFSASAEENKKAPHAVVQHFTTEVMAIIKADQELFKTAPDKYFYKIQKKLEPYVGLGLIAKRVMGKYEKTASKLEAERFFQVFSRSLVVSLGLGLAPYADLNIVTLPYDVSKGELDSVVKVEVVQQIDAVDGATYVSYTMAKNETGHWQMVNVILNGINLGKQFRNQFKQAMKQSDNKMSEVVNNWSVSG